MNKTIADVYGALQQVEASYSIEVFKDGSGNIKKEFEEVPILTFKDLDEAWEFFHNLLRVTVVVLSNGVTAKVTHNEIKIGNETFPLETAKLIVRVMDKIENRVGKTVPFNEVRVGEKIKFSPNSHIIYTRVSPKSMNTNETLMLGNGQPAYCDPKAKDLVEIVG